MSTQNGTQQNLFGSTSDEQLAELAERILQELNRRTNAVDPNSSNGHIDAAKGNDHKKRTLKPSELITEFEMTRVVRYTDGRYRAYWNVGGMGTKNRSSYIIERDSFKVVESVARALDKSVRKEHVDIDFVRNHGTVMAAVARHLVTEMTGTSEIADDADGNCG